MGIDEKRLIADLKMAQSTGRRRVGLLATADKDFRHLESRQRAQFSHHFLNYGNPDVKSLPPEHFKFEMREKIGKGGSLAIFAFKAFKARIYGIVISDGAVETFVGSHVVEKKTNKADQGALRVAARRFDQYWND